MNKLIVAQTLINDEAVYVSTVRFSDGKIETLALDMEKNKPIYLEETLWRNLGHALRRHCEACLFAIKDYSDKWE